MNLGKPPPLRITAEPPMGKLDRIKLPSRARGEKCPCPIKGMADREVSLKLDLDEVGGTSLFGRKVVLHRGRRGSVWLADAAQRLLRLRRNTDVTVQRLHRNVDVTAEPNGCNTVSAGAVETGDCIANETADSLGSAVLVAACGAFVAVLRNHAKIVRAHANRESPKPAARPFPQGSHSLDRRSHGDPPLLEKILHVTTSPFGKGAPGLLIGCILNRPRRGSLRLAPAPRFDRFALKRSIR